MNRYPPLPKEVMQHSNTANLMRAYVDADRAMREQAQPVAFMTADGRVSMRETVESSMPNSSRVSFNIPLYLHPAAPQAQPAPERKPLFADLIAQHEGLADELKDKP